MTLLTRSLLLGAVAAVVWPAADAAAQIRASEPSTFTQAIDGTEFRIEYYRPRTRDRGKLFGMDAVVWEHIWTPGANWATKLGVSKDVTIGGVEVPSGVYSVWMEMDDQMMPHELFLEPDTMIFHTDSPAPADDQIHIPLTHETDAPFVEVLRWDFEDISSRGGTLALRWGTNRFAWDVVVPSSMRLTVTEEEAAPVLGMWEVQMMGPGGPSPAFQIEFSHGAKGNLHADIMNMPLPPNPTPNQVGEAEWFESLDMWLLPRGPGFFMPGEAYDGVLWETWADMLFEFSGEGGSYDRFEIRNDLDQVMMAGTRAGG
jgi:hypothetical protein